MAAISTRVAQTCEDLGYDFVIRVAQDRVVEVAEEDAPEDLKTLARALPATSAHFLSIPAHHHHPKREVFLQMRPAKSASATANRWSLPTENGASGLGGARLGPPPGTRAARMDSLDDPAHHVPVRWVEGGAMVWLALDRAKISTRRESTGCRIEERFCKPS